MKRKLGTTLLLSLVLATSFALTFASEEGAVEQAERDFAKAVVANDFEALNRLLADDLYYSHSNWAVDTKASYIDKLKAGTARYWALDIKEIKVQMLDADMAVVASISDFVTKAADGSRQEATLKTLHVFRKNAGQWELVAHQSARKPE